ncbi:single-stranded DNA-binding protein [Brevibacterium luteolum]|uniref:single-stranded DNA-binding protein n=1 Tax=Brevibacterium luteolum TaxID=199591 RepID=UPI001C237D4D|nr:single-stranded DNA-binding protein [Brevibacterium luteolum]MBU8577595.1 single-stranded DNA-binding protein [Brevibacterium luteolum]
MSMHTQTSTSGFIASDPQLSETAKGDARFYARFGQEHYRREDDGSFTQLETTYHNMVMFGRSARHAHERFAKGDKFIAEGYTRTPEFERDGTMIAGEEEFIAKRIGHDTARTRYAVDRTPRRPAAEHAAERQAPSFDPPERQQQTRPAPAMGL